MINKIILFLKEFFSNEENDGVLQEQIQPTDWILGKETGVVFEEVTDDWEPYLPKAESQNIDFETFSCVSFALNNVVETQLHKLMSNGKLSNKAITYLKDKGYIVDGKINFSDAYLAIGSGTTDYGNSGSIVSNWARHNGFVPESLFPIKGKNTDEYLNSKIPQDVLDLGKQFFKNIGYELVFEWIPTHYKDLPDILKTHIKQCPLQVFTPICPSYKNKDKIIKSCPLRVSHHSYVFYKIDEYYRAFDQYEPFKKTLKTDYPVLYVLKTVLKPIKDTNDRPTYKWTKPLRNGDKGEDVKKLQEVLIYEGLLNKDLNTGYFGVNTFNAVKQLQLLHAKDILVDVSYPTGYVGQRTLYYLNKNYGTNN